MLKVIWLTWTLTAGGDILSTHYAIAHGAREVNPLLQNPVTRDAIVGVQTGSGAYATQQLYRSKHERWALGITIAVGGLHTWAAIHNMQQGRH